MKLALCTALLAMFCCFTQPALALDKPTVRVCVPGDVLTDYKLFIGKHDPLLVRDFKGPASRRDVVEMVLIQQALALGGKQVELEFVIINSYARILEQLKSGHVLMAMNSIWHCDLEKHMDKVYISTPMIKVGEFVAGCYVLKSNAKALQSKTLSDICSLRVVSNNAWTIDWKTLQAMDVKDLQSTAQWSSMVNMLGAGRADMLLAPFQGTDDFSLVHNDITLIPIPGIKVGLQDSRHCAISRMYPKGEEYFKALNRGLALLEKRGLIKRAYQDAGFFNMRVEEWTLINKASASADDAKSTNINTQN